MKTKTNALKACLTTAVFSAALLSGSVVVAQSDLEVSQNEEFNQALERLDVLMTAFEEAARYVAPASYEEEDANLVLERLEIFADRAQSELKYAVPDLDFKVETTLASDDNENGSDKTELLTYAKRISRIR